MLDGFLGMFKRPELLEVTPIEIQQRLGKGEQLHLVDVRTAEECAQGHIPGARLIPLDQLRDRAGEIDRNREVILVCRSGNRSAQAYRLLQGLGFSNLRNMTGGMLSWQGPTKRS